MKTCSRCKTAKALDDFHRRARSKDGRQPECRSCSRAYYARRGDELRARGRELYRLRGREQHRARRYGLTAEGFAELVAKQGAACGICREPLGDEIIVDHDHETGEIRGLLCRPCNSGIGHLGDDPERVRAALDYLEARR